MFGFKTLGLSGALLHPDRGHDFEQPPRDRVLLGEDPFEGQGELEVSIIVDFQEGYLVFNLQRT